LDENSECLLVERRQRKVEREKCCFVVWVTERREYKGKR